MTAQLFTPSIARPGLESAEDAEAIAPLDAKATFARLPGVGDAEGVGLGATVGVGLGAIVGVGLGTTVGVGDGCGAGEPPPHASSSTTRLYPSAAEFTTTLILDAVSGANVNRRNTLLLPLTLPPGTSTHPNPFQY